MLDVLIAGAGPAGSIAALRLARAGARVVLVDRETFPRDKLCGDTLNPGAIAWLAAQGLSGDVIDRARPLAGMLMSGPRVAKEARYPAGIVGRAVLRRHLDAWLLDRAIAAGARFEPGLTVKGPLLHDERGVSHVRGLLLAPRTEPDRVSRMPATLTIAADGRRSTLAFSLGLCAHPPHPRRWAFGVYATGIDGVRDVGEMHVRRGVYIGVAPITDALSNVCVVTGPRPEGRAPLDVVKRAIGSDALLARRFERATFESRVSVLGPLAVEARAAGMPGLLLAGDAAGFVDPMTGDGLHLAMRGAALAADEILHVLEHGDLAGAPARLAQARDRMLGSKLRFNRAVRQLVASPAAVRLAELGALIAPGVLTRAVRYAGDAA